MSDEPAPEAPTYPTDPAVPPMEGAPAPGGAPMAAPAVPGPAPTAGRGRMLAAIAAVVVVVIVVVAALALVGVGPFHKTSTAGSGTNGADTYTEARAAANSTASSAGAGPWDVFYAAGIDLSSPATIDLTTDFPTDSFSDGLLACNGAFASGLSTTVVVPSYSGNLGAGAAPAWIFAMYETSGTILLVGVMSGQATIWETFSGADCATITSYLGGLANGIVDSSVAVAAAWNDGGSSFASAHPGGSLVMAALPGTLGLTAVWDVAYATCPVTGSPASGTTYYEFNTSVSEATGSVLATPTAGSTNCSNYTLTSTPTGGSGSSTAGCVDCPALGSVLGISSATLGSDDDWTFTVQSASGGITIGDLDIDVFNTTAGANDTTHFDSWELDAASGCGLDFGLTNSTYSATPIFGSVCAGTTGPTVVLTAGMVVDLTTVPGGYGGSFDEVEITAPSHDTGLLIASFT